MIKVARVIIVLLACSWLAPALAANATGPPGLQGLSKLIWMIAVYPVVGIGLSWLLFTVVRKPWVFFLAPLLPIAIGEASPAGDYPRFLSLEGTWFYWTHIAGVAGSYLMFMTTGKVWLFCLAPVIGWIIQVASLGVIAT